MDHDLSGSQIPPHRLKPAATPQSRITRSGKHPRPATRRTYNYGSETADGSGRFGGLARRPVTEAVRPATLSATVSLVQAVGAEPSHQSAKQRRQSRQRAHAPQTLGVLSRRAAACRLDLVAIPQITTQSASAQWRLTNAADAHDKQILTPDKSATPAPAPMLSPDAVLSAPTASRNSRASCSSPPW
jgi:hypothetical protein